MPADDLWEHRNLVASADRAAIWEQTLVAEVVQQMLEILAGRTSFHFKAAYGTTKNAGVAVPKIRLRNIDKIERRLPVLSDVGCMRFQFVQSDLLGISTRPRRLFQCFADDHDLRLGNRSYQFTVQICMAHSQMFLRIIRFCFTA